MSDSTAILPISHKHRRDNGFRPSLSQSSPHSAAPMDVLHFPLTKVVDVRVPYVPPAGLSRATGVFSRLTRFAITFLIFLHSNVNLPSSTPISDDDIPPTPTSYSASSSASSVCDLSSNASSVDVTSPAVVVGPVDDKESIQDVVRLVTESISQQHHTAAFYMMLHPGSIACLLVFFIFMLFMPIADYYAHYIPNIAVGRLLFASVASLTVYVTVTELVCSSYEMYAAAYRQNPDLLPPTTDRFAKQDILVAVRRGSEIIASAIVRVYPNPSASRRRKSPPGSAVIRAWTTRKDARNCGFGYMVLRAAVKEARVYCGKDVRISFSRFHANSKSMSFGLFKNVMMQREKLATRVLADVLAAFEVPRKKR
ncbi:acetyltransferase, GNAT family [Ceratocystis lukuohia]|uniref:Acetyltransferase, GNAT family n=1 Tax=Ceratocystis lukuohia TaxID=2019550 RepID=A0ABR4MR42_9PEZI